MRDGGDPALRPQPRLEWMRPGAGADKGQTQEGVGLATLRTPSPKPSEKALGMRCLSPHCCLWDKGREG